MAVVLVLAIVSAMLSLGTARITRASLNTTDTNKVTLQAQAYASSKADILKVTSYTDLATQSKTQITNSNGFYDEVSVGTESTYKNNIKQKECIVRVYKGAESIPRASLTVVRYSVEKEESSGVPVGTVIAWAGIKAPTTNGTWLECNGQSCASYPELVAVLGKSTVPDYRNKFLESSTTAGTIKSAGLPNIKGTFTTEALSATGTTGNPSPSGAFYLTKGSFRHLATNTDPNNWIINFDASRSSSIYGNSTTVQPASVTVRRFIKAA